MKKILIFSFFIILFSFNVFFAEDYDTIPLTLSNFNFEFDYITPNTKLTLSNFNFEFDYILQTFKFDLTQYISDYERYQKITELYPQLSGIKSTIQFWHELATLENDNYYREPNLPYLKFKRLADKYK